MGSLCRSHPCDQLSCCLNELNYKCLNQGAPACVCFQLLLMLEESPSDGIHRQQDTVRVVSVETPDTVELATLDEGM